MNDAVEAIPGDPQDPAEAISGSPVVSVGYMEAIRFPFAGPHAWTNILLLSAANLVPMIGPIVGLGYILDTMEALFRQKRSYAPPMDVDRLSEYLMRGVWVVVMQLGVAAVVIPAMFLLLSANIAAIAMFAQGGDTAIAGAFVIGAGQLLYFLLMSVLGFLLTPIFIRIGLTQDLAKGFDWAWTKSFLAKTWAELFVVTLVLQFLGMAYSFAGMALFCVGAFFVVGVLYPTSIHLYYQLYLLFLARGGQAVELKEPSTKALANWAK